MESLNHSILVDLPAVGSREDDFPPTERSIRASCEILLDEMRREREEAGYFELSVSVVGDDDIREVNREHRGKDSATDVLSFPLLDTGEEFPIPGGFTSAGDILISHETCREQAREIGHSNGDEFQRLLVHGLLHLFGYDHETSAADEIVMRKREDELLALLAERGL